RIDPSPRPAHGSISNWRDSEDAADAGSNHGLRKALWNTQSWKEDNSWKLPLAPRCWLAYLHSRAERRPMDKSPAVGSDTQGRWFRWLAWADTISSGRSCRRRRLFA